MHSQIEFDSQADDPAMRTATPHLQLDAIRCVMNLVAFLPKSQLATFNGIANALTEYRRHGLHGCAFDSRTTIILCIEESEYLLI